MSGTTVIMSDIHASTGKKPAWFVEPYVSTTVDLLNGFAQAGNVSELVLLGDIFDLWVYPVDQVPLQLDQILAVNSTLTQALQNCVAKLPRVSYVAGNHDMGLSASDLGALSSGGKQVQAFVPRAGWHLEHGHSVDMFNAPDAASDTVGGYSLGFFISRLAASAADPGAWPTRLQALVQKAVRPEGFAAEAIDLQGLGRRLVQTILLGMAEYAGVKPNTYFRFSEPDLDKRYTVADVANSHYGSLLGTWYTKYPSLGTLLSSMLTSVLDSGLDWYAQDVLKNPAVKALVFGHTHFAETGKAVYRNDGCCCGNKSGASPNISYVTIDEKDQAQVRTVAMA